MARLILFTWLEKKQAQVFLERCLIVFTVQVFGQHCHWDTGWETMYGKRFYIGLHYQAQPVCWNRQQQKHLPVKTISNLIILKIKKNKLMCNCGNKRNELTQEARPLSNSLAGRHTIKKMWPDVQFKYTGGTALTIYGSITGKKYRFVQPNDVQLVDYRDASSMMGVTVLMKTG